MIAPGFEPERDRFGGRLTVVAGPEHVGDQFLLGGPGPIEIGKLDGKHILLNGQRVSRSHCRLVRAAEGWRIEDQKSTNGLFVNDQRVTFTLLRDEDVVGIGDYKLRFAGASPAAVGAGVGEESRQEARSEARTEECEQDAKAPADAGVEVRLEKAKVEDDGVGLGDDLYALSEGEAVEIERLNEPAPAGASEQPPQTGGPVCPSCGKPLPAGAKICVVCGIDLKTGKAILTSQETNLDTIYVSAEGIIWWVSWISTFGLYPIASEAFGTRKPYVIRGLAIVTILTSVWFWAYKWTDSPTMMTAKNYMLWAGEKEPKPGALLYYYVMTSYGDTKAFEEKIQQLEPAARKRLGGKYENAELPDEIVAQMVLAAHNSLPPERQCFGRFHGYQLITAAFLHSGFLHLAGNLLFLLVIGSRVNALLGNVVSLALYLLLAVFSGLAWMVSTENSPPHAMLGASGAIMGLAGMYIVLMPMHKVHVVCWARLWWLLLFRLRLKMFAVRGFWVVLFYISFDVLYTILQWKDGVAHWAHLGGFIAGAVIALLLLCGRLVNPRGGDLLSGLLGRHAWGLIGKPANDRRAPMEYLP